MLRVVSLAAAVIAAAALAGGSTAGKTAFPEVIQLPAGFQPEGIEVGRGTTFYVGSRVTGAIFRGNLRTGTGAIFVPGGAGRLATGIEFSRNRLFVAGAGTGDGYVYNARTGALVRTYDFTSGDTFINDVVVTHSAAYFTDSRKAVLYKVPIGPGGALGRVRDESRSPATRSRPAGASTSMASTRPETARRWSRCRSNTGKLFRINPTTGVAREIQLADGESVPNGDGILLTGRTLYVVQNQNNRVAVICTGGELRFGHASSRGCPTRTSRFRRRSTISAVGSMQSTRASECQTQVPLSIRSSSWRSRGSAEVSEQCFRNLRGQAIRQGVTDASCCFFGRGRHCGCGAGRRIFGWQVRLSRSNPARRRVQPEGIEVGKGTTFYVGSRVTGAIAVGDLRTGEQANLVQGGQGRPATGIELDRTSDLRRRRRNR